jgi:integrase
MTCYAEKRKGKLTGKWIAEASLQLMGKRTRIRERFDSKGAGDRWADTCELLGKRLPKADGAPEKPTAPTFSQVAQELKDAGGPDGAWAHGKDASVLQRLAYATESALGAKLITDIRYSEVETLILALAKRPGQQEGTKISPSTLNRYITAISAVLTYAARKAYIQAPPPLPWQKPSKKKKYGYTPVQEAIVVDGLRANGWLAEATCFEVLSLSALRWGELAGLVPSQVDEEFINLDDPESIKNGETGTIYIGEQLARALRALLAAKGLPDYHTMRKRVVTVLESAGLEIPRALHSLRHTAATRTVNSGMDIQVAKELLRHKNIQTTLGYRHVSKEVLRERAKNLSPHAGLGGGQVVNLADHTAAKALENLEDFEATSGIEPEYTVLQTECK